MDPSSSPILYYALRTKTLPLAQLDQYAETDLAQRLSTVDGVAQVQVYGSQKYAVRVGGGGNPRLALWDGILIKENHIAAAGGVTPALRRAQALQAGVNIQIEVETLDQLREALDAGAASVLLDNFSLERMREAVTITAGRALSGPSSPSSRAPRT